MTGSGSVEGSGSVGPIRPGMLPPSEKKITEVITASQRLVPPPIPISSMRAKPFEQKKSAEVMKAKAMTAFTTKEMMMSGKAPMQSTMAGVGGMFMGVNAPIGVYNTYSLVKNWDDHSWNQRAMKATEISGNVLLTGAGTALLVSQVPQLSEFLGLSMQQSMQATTVAFILGPIGMGLFAALNLTMGAISTKDAIQYQKKAAKAKALLQDVDLGSDKGSIQKAVLTREAARYTRARNYAITNAAKSFFVGIGIGLGAIFMAGVVIGALATPVGWSAVGLVGAGLLISIGMLVVRNRYSAKREQEENEALAKELAAPAKHAANPEEYLRKRLEQILPLEFSHEEVLDSNLMKLIEKELSQ